MIHTGHTQDLTILRSTSVGLFLGDGQGNEVLLPNKYVPTKHDQGSTISVFVYRDSEDRQVATTLDPLIHLGEFAPLRVNAISPAGAFMGCGLEKDLLVPHSEQRRPPMEGECCVVYMALDEKTDRLYGSTRVERFLDNAVLTVDVGNQVQLLVHARSPLGWPVIVNGKHLGLVHASEVFGRIAIGDQITGFVKQIRPDNKLDITLHPPGYAQYNNVNVAAILHQLQAHDGFLPYTDKSSPEEIHRAFGISKKAFKQAVGALYKARKISLGEHGIKLEAGPGGKATSKS